MERQKDVVADGNDLVENDGEAVEEKKKILLALLVFGFM